VLLKQADRGPPQAGPAAARPRDPGHWAEPRAKFVKVFPHEYKRALARTRLPRQPKPRGHDKAKAKAQAADRAAK
jgi:hypothetical protein